jgi:hypothetical protein
MEKTLQVKIVSTSMLMLKIPVFHLTGKFAVSCQISFDENICINPPCHDSRIIKGSQSYVKISCVLEGKDLTDSRVPECL